jgi:hypothetical protein
VANENRNQAKQPVVQNGSAVEELAASLFARNWSRNLPITPDAFALETLEAAKSFYDAVAKVNKPS